MTRTIRTTCTTRMTRFARTLLVATAVATLLVACGGADDPTEPTDPTDPTDSAEPTDPGGSSDDSADGADDTDLGDGMDEDGVELDDRDDTADGTSGALSGRVEVAVADAAAHFDVDPGDIEVVTAEAVTWPDGAIGCPQPDMMYTQALVEGYRIVLSVDGDEVAYHGEDGGDPRRCDDPQDPVS